MNRNGLYLLSLSFAVVMLMRANAAWSESQLGAPAKAKDAVSEIPPALSIEGTEEEPAAECLTGVVAAVIQSDREALEERALEITKRNAALEALEKRVKLDLEKIEMANASVQAEVDKLEAIATGDLKHLISMYEAMKPKKAAEIFSKMDPAFAAGFIRQIKPATAGLILSEMESGVSYKVSLIIANQNLEWRNSTEK